MKLLTKTGENFIRTICSGTGNSLLSGKYKYTLPFSNLGDVTFTAEVKDRNGRVMGSNQELGEELIYWFNKYATEADTDANLLAAQAYVESGYRVWHYNKFNSGSGIVNLQAIKAYTHIVNSESPLTIEGLANLFFDENEVNMITTGLTSPTIETSYLYRGNKINDTTKAIAIANRPILHQNLINNTELIVKAQASIMKEILERNNYQTATALLAYKTYWLLQAESYPKAVDYIGGVYGDTVLKNGIEYVNNVFRCLGDKNNQATIKGKLSKPAGIWFGYDIKFEKDSFSSNLG